MNEGGRATPGTKPLAASLRQLASTLLELVQLRLELLGTELEAQKLAIAAGLIWGAVAVALFSLALVLFAVGVLVLFWDAYRLQAVAVMLLLYLGGGVLAWRHALTRLAVKPGLFALNVAELARDRASLVPDAAEAAPPRQPS